MPCYQTSNPYFEYMMYLFFAILGLIAALWEYSASSSSNECGRTQQPQMRGCDVSVTSILELCRQTQKGACCGQQSGPGATDAGCCGRAGNDPNNKSCPGGAKSSGGGCCGGQGTCSASTEKVPSKADDFFAACMLQAEPSSLEGRAEGNNENLDGDDKDASCGVTRCCCQNTKK